MAHIIDIILIAGFFFAIILAAKKGFAKIVMDIGATVLSFIAAYALSRPAAELVYEKVIKGMIENSLEEKLKEIPAADALSQARALAGSIPQGLVSLGDKMGFNVGTLIENINKADISLGNISASVTDSVFKPIVLTVATAVCGLIIFILASIIFGIAAKLINKIFKLPLVKSVNRALGGVLGIVEGVIFMFVACTLAYFIGGLTDGKLSEYIGNSVIIEAVNGFNPILERFKG